MKIYGLLAFFLTLCAILNTPYKLIGLFFTRKFKPAKNNHKYAIMIPAKNEESVIGNLIDSIHKQDYPNELVTIFVVADNCTDNTAIIARNKGAICYERFNETNKTKGFALQFLVNKIEDDYGTQAFDGYFIFDADNLLKEDYISRMNDSFDSGQKLITSYRASKNFDDNWISSTYALHWIRSIRTKHRARSILRLATNIQGTGFLFASEIIKDGWNYTSLTEDRALTADCVIKGYEITYNNDAIFYDEQPISLRIAIRQRLRWSKGHLLTFAKSGPTLLKNIFIDKTTKRTKTEHWYTFMLRSLRHRLMSFDTFCQLLPANIIKVTRWIICSLFLYPFVCYQLGMENIKLFYNSTYIGQIFVKLFGDYVLTLEPGLQTYFICMGLTIWFNIWKRICLYIKNIVLCAILFILERKRIKKISIWKKILYCITWPTFDIIGRYTQYIALFRKVDWKPIPHQSNVTIDDIKEQKGEL